MSYPKMTVIMLMTFLIFMPLVQCRQKGAVHLPMCFDCDFGPYQSKKCRLHGISGVTVCTRLTYIDGIEEKELPNYAGVCYSVYFEDGILSTGCASLPKSFVKNKTLDCLEKYGLIYKNETWPPYPKFRKERNIYFECYCTGDNCNHENWDGKRDLLVKYANATPGFVLPSDHMEHMKIRNTYKKGYYTTGSEPPKNLNDSKSSKDSPNSNAPPKQTAIDLILIILLVGFLNFS